MVFHNPAVRWAMGVSSGLIIAAVGFLFLTGTAQLVAYGIALFEIFLTPQILKKAAENQ